jgi:hypothetical protein
MTGVISQGAEILQKMQEQARELPSALLRRLGRWRPAVEKLREFGKAASEVSVRVFFFANKSQQSFQQLHPVAKAVVGAVNVVYQVSIPSLSAQEIRSPVSLDAGEAGPNP